MSKTIQSQAKVGLLLLFGLLFLCLAFGLSQYVLYRLLAQSLGEVGGLGVVSLELFGLGLLSLALTRR